MTKAWVIYFSLLALIVFGLAAIAQDEVEIPESLTAKSCQELAIREGVGIAQLHWGQGVTKAQWDATPYKPGLPEWYMKLMDKWFESADAWEGSPNDWLNHIVRGCAGLSDT